MVIIVFMTIEKQIVQALPRNLRLKVSLSLIIYIVNRPDELIGKAIVKIYVVY